MSSVLFPARRVCVAGLLWAAFLLLSFVQSASAQDMQTRVMPVYPSHPMPVPSQPSLGVYAVPYHVITPWGHVSGVKVTHDFARRNLYQVQFGQQRRFKFRTHADVILRVNGQPVHSTWDVSSNLHYGWNTLEIWDTYTQAHGNYSVYLQ